MESVIDSVTGVLVGKSLDVALLRHQAIASNIANVDTQGYAPKEVKFDAFLKELSAQAGNFQEVSASDLRAKLSSIDDRSFVSVNRGGQVKLDQEMVELTKNTVNYQALLAANSQLGSLLSKAIKGGKQ